MSDPLRTFQDAVLVKSVASRFASQPKVATYSGAGEVIPSKRWKHKDSGALASLYGAVPWSGAPGDRKEDWQLEDVGYTIQWSDGTVGTGQKPFKTEDEAHKWLDAYRARRNKK
jgi:hypothetical protein